MAPAIRLSLNIVEKDIQPEGIGFVNRLVGFTKRRAHVLVVETTFSEEAKAAIKQLKLDDHWIISANVLVPSHLEDKKGAWFTQNIPYDKEKHWFISDFIGGVVEISYRDVFAARAGSSDIVERFRIFKGMLAVAEKPTNRTVEI